MRWGKIPLGPALNGEGGSGGYKTGDNECCDQPGREREMRWHGAFDDELGIDDGDDSDEAICNCGAKNCRGTMYAPEEVKKRKAAKRKAEQKATRKLAQTKGKKRL